jgi:hypothetical protein
MASYLSLWLGRGWGGGVRLLSAASIERIETCLTLPYPGPEQRYGLGNDVDQIDGYVGRGHTGVYEGFIASFRYFPREGVAWALLFNSNDASTRIAVEREVLRFLMRGRTAATPPAVKVSLDALRQLAGTYRSETPPSELFALAPSIDVLEIDEADGVLFERRFRQQGLFQRLLREPKRELVPVGPGAFRHPDEAVSSRLFVRAGNGPAALIVPDGYLRRIPRALVQMQRYLFFSALLVLLTEPLVALLWVPGLLMRGRPWPSNLSSRVFPLLAALSFIAAYAVLWRSPQRWGRLNMTTVSACLLTWAFAILAVAALYFSLKAPARFVGRWSKLHSVLVGVAACGLAGYFWCAHWVGIQLWKW